MRFIFIQPFIKTSKTFSLFTGINFYAGLGCYGVAVGILGFGFILERFE